MAEFFDAAGVNELQSGQMKSVIIDGNEILLARVGDRYYAAENRCPHMGANLSLGELNGTVITCPRHHSQFDLTDGHVVRWTDWSGLGLSLAKMIKSPHPLKIYDVKMEKDRVMVGHEKIAS
jgi:3-phenylpropionate/trans-cinnamate dioxygenase ferredoxin subunit